MEILHGAPMIGDILRGSLKNLVDRKAVVIRRWIRDGRLADVDPRHLLFTIWSVTQHYADFEVQVAALTGHSLRDPGFEARVVENVLAIVLHGALPRTS
jgi:TetR/AcrR family transcriptional regulator